MVAIRPLRDWVIVRRKETAQSTRAGIIIPDSAQQASQEGTVVAVGPGYEMPSGYRVPPGVKVGDQVVFGKHAGSDRDVGDETLLFIVASQLEAVRE